MRHAEGALKTADGDSLYWQCWMPQGNPRAILLLAHGLAEHSGRYSHFAEFFERRGYAVYALDHLGHGRSNGVRCHIRCFSQFTDGLQLLLARCRADYPGTPVFLVGHSMGGLVAVHFLFTHQSDIAGCILSGAALEPAEELSFIQRFLMRLFSRTLPRMRLLQLDSSKVSRDPEVVERYRSDPLVFNGKVTARLAEQLFTAMHGLTNQLGTLETPMLILHGASDGLTAADGSRMLYERTGSADKKLIIYDGLYHEIYNEPEKETVMTDVADWLDRG
jgi:alpha-beta hydrolase superfamily lysophospholipase